MLQDAAHILFRHAVVDGPGGLQALRRFPLFHAPGKSNLLQRLAGNFGMRRRPGDDDAHAVIYLAKIEGAGRGRIGIAVALHRLFGPRRIQCVQDLSAPAPIGDACAFQMGDDNRHAGIGGRYAKASLMAARISSASVRMCEA